MSGPEPLREIVVVCYGNICRSPMGEVLLQAAIERRFGPGHPFLVTSAGIGADDGRPPSQGSIRSMSQLGVDLRSHRSRYLTERMAREAWRILCMEDYQVEHVRKMLRPDDAHKARTLGEEVLDPLGTMQGVYDMVRDHIASLLPAVVEEIAAGLAAERGAP